ncbi:MAG: glycosyltransferase family 4 protein [Ectothiorhodospiraceae bacterium]|nr:glycosyltransferase family 4 protein [Ectothiorhodospiraceae bacterium]
MRILMTALWPVGGIRAFLRYMYREEVFADCQFDLIAPDEGLTEHLDEHLPPGRLRVFPCERGSKALIRQVRARRREHCYDLLHSHGFSAGTASELARTGTGTPHLLTAHDMFLPTTFSGWKGSIKRTALQALFKRVTAIHAVSGDAGRNIRTYLPRVSEKRIHPILHGVDTSLFSEAIPMDLSSVDGLPENALVIGFFARFMAPKGFRTLVDAVELLVRDRAPKGRPIRVLTFGWGGFIREDYGYLESRGLSEHFLQLPATEEPGRWMKSVDVVAMPSRWEACGLLAMEALSAGAPIAGTRCVGLREVLEGSPAPTCEPGDARGFAEALLKASEPGARDTFQAYQPDAIRRFSIARPAKALRALYSELAGAA